MAGFDSIDYNTLARILRYAVGPRVNGIVGWAPCLQLLHVCSLWTEITTPLVLHMAFIRLRLSKGKHFGIFTIHRPKLEYYSNIDIIISRGYHTLVNNLFIAANSYMGYAEFFEHVFFILQSDKYEWPGVHNLYINMVTDMGEYLNIHADSILVPSESECQNYADMFYRCMPRIQQLTVHEPNPEKGVFVNKLANLYAHQLNYLTSLNPISLLETKFCANLTHLNIKLDPDRKPLYLPLLSAAPLQYLSLINVPPQFSWAEFYDADGCNITFHNLEHLRLMFLAMHKPKSNLGLDRVHKAQKKSPKFIYYKLHFPSLENLWIENCPSESELLHCQPYFSDMHEIVVEGPVESVALTVEMGLQKQNKLKIFINHATLAQKELFYATTNHLFSKLDIGSESCLGVNVNFNQFDIQFIQWSKLRKLFVFSCVDVSNYISLLVALPNLITTVARRLVINTEMLAVENDSNSNKPNSESQSANSSRSQSISSTTGSHLSRFRRLTRIGWTRGQTVFESLQTLHVEPLLRTKMQKMALYFDDNSPGTIEFRAITIAYIIFKFGALTDLQLDLHLKHYFSHFISKYADSIPHMSDIDIQYAEMHIDPRTFNHYFYTF